MATANAGRAIRLNSVSNRPASLGVPDEWGGNDDDYDDDDEDTGNDDDDNSTKRVSKDAQNHQISLFNFD